MLTATKDFYAMNLPEGQAEKLIQKYESDVTQNLADLAKIEPSLKEAEQMYLEIKADHDKKSKELEENKAMLDVFVRFRNNDSGTKEFRILRTTSNLEKPGKIKHKREFRWLNLAEEVLGKEDRFMAPVALYHAILKANPNIEQLIKDKGKNIAHVEHLTLMNFARTCEEAREGKKGRRFIDYHGRIGLMTWVLDDFTPEPKYLKEFMHATGPTKNGHKIIPARTAAVVIPVKSHKVQAKTQHRVKAHR